MNIETDITKGPLSVKGGMIYADNDPHGETIAFCGNTAFARAITALPELIEACNDIVENDCEDWGSTE